jgi:ligand-binding SRPBCC domain-containing protein
VEPRWSEAASVARELAARMFTLKDSTHIAAPLERVFLLSCSLKIVERELGMRAVAGKGSTRTEGLVTGGDRIRWEGWQLGFWNYHVSLISGFRANEFFQDKMIAGRFKSFLHDHEFTEIGGQVLLKDTIRFSLPWGFAGRLVGKKILVPHIGGLMRRRFALLKRIAESEEWREYLPEAEGRGELEAVAEQVRKRG